MVVLAGGPRTLRAQGQTGSGTIAGRVTDSTGNGLAAGLHVVGNLRFSTYASPDGFYAITGVPAGTARVVARFLGFRTDTFSVMVPASGTITHHVVLRTVSRTLEPVTVTSARLNETTAGALQEQKDADNVISVMSGDEIRSLPNSNAAEALARMPGVTAERDEGEGKYVEIRGTPPSFQHVTINGAYVPGTLANDVRAVKLDDVPSDLLGAIEVSKTLTADQDASAIGGSVNLVTKVPDGAPRGYIAGQYAYQTLLGHSNGQGSVTYGGRVGDNHQFGFLFSSSYDRTNRVISDVEPSYSADYLSNGVYTPIPNGSGFNHVYPSSWSERDTTTFGRGMGRGAILTTASLPRRRSSSRGCGARFSTRRTAGRRTYLAGTMY